MPQPAEVDAIRDDLHRHYQQAWQHIEQQLTAIANQPPDRVAVLRRRLNELSRDINTAMSDLDLATRGWVQQQLPLIYELGGQAAADQLGDQFSWAQHHRAAIQQLARTTFDDLLAATKFVRADAKRLTREMARAETVRSIVEGDTAQRAGRALADQLRTVFGTEPLAAVRYSNGARHSLADYADTVLRTQTATAFNAGTLNTGTASGVQFVEVNDGPDCGWTAHDDPDLANGTIRTLEEAQQQTIAHPRCARSFGLRPDLTTPADAAGARRFTPDQQQTMATAERARATAQRPRLSRPAQARRQATVDRRAARLAHAPAPATSTTIPDRFVADVNDSRMLHGHQTDQGFQYDPERVARYHEPYYAKQTDGAKAVAEPEFRVMGGGPASGKSSVIRSGDVHLPDGHVMVNADDAKEMLPEYQAGVRDGNAGAAAFVHEESSDMGKRLAADALRSSYNTVLDGTGNGGIDSLAKKIETARANGAKRIVGDYVTVDTDEAVRRAVLRGEKSGRHVPESIIRGTHASVSNTFRQAADRDLFDELRLWDNNGSAPRLIYERTDGVERILDPAAYDSFLRKTPGYA